MEVKSRGWTWIHLSNQARRTITKANLSHPPHVVLREWAGSLNDGPTPCLMGLYGMRTKLRAGHRIGQSSSSISRRLG